MKRITFILFLTITIISCRENLEERAYREAKEYTQKNCPTPPQNNSILDSMSFDKQTKTFNYHYTIIGETDNKDNFIGKETEMHRALIEEVKNDIGLTIYKDAGFDFQFIYRSNKNKNEILYKDKIKASDYK